MRTSGKLELTKVRHPRERLVFALSLLANAAVIAGAVALLYLAPEWVAAHGRVSKLVDRIRLAGVALLLFLPLLGLLRRGHWAEIRENSVHVCREQVPEVFHILERHCGALGVPPPELYASTLDTVGLSAAIELRDRRIIVLGASLFTGVKLVRDRADVLEFAIASELGRLALGHASWWDDLLFAYLKRIPVVRMPLVTVQTASRDRFAVTLAPGSIRGLLLVACGGSLLDHVDPATFVRQTLREDTLPLWAWIGRLRRGGPDVAQRVRGLFRSGFVDERDVAPRTDGGPAAADLVRPGGSGSP